MAIAIIVALAGLAALLGLLTLFALVRAGQVERELADRQSATGAPEGVTSGAPIVRTQHERATGPEPGGASSLPKHGPV